MYICSDLIRTQGRRTVPSRIWIHLTMAISKGQNANESGFIFAPMSSNQWRRQTTMMLWTAVPLWTFYHPNPQREYLYNEIRRRKLKVKKQFQKCKFSGGLLIVQFSHSVSKSRRHIETNFWVETMHSGWLNQILRHEDVDSAISESHTPPNKSCDLQHPIRVLYYIVVGSCNNTDICLCLWHWLKDLNSHSH